eukprot:3514909-Rhodomonas_salina.1
MPKHSSEKQQTLFFREYAFRFLTSNFLYICPRTNLGTMSTKPCVHSERRVLHDHLLEKRRSLVQVVEPDAIAGRLVWNEATGAHHQPKANQIT